MELRNVDFFEKGYNAVLHRSDIDLYDYAQKVEMKFGKEAVSSFKSGMYQAATELGEVGISCDIMNKFIAYETDEEVIKAVGRNLYKTPKQIKRLQRRK